MKRNRTPRKTKKRLKKLTNKFKGCKSFNKPWLVNGFDFSEMTNISEMFKNTKFIQYSIQRPSKHRFKLKKL